MIRPATRKSVKSALCAAAASAATFAAGPALAAPMIQNYDVDFSSPSQAFWGPGKSAASFNFDSFALGTSSFLGSTSFGVRFQAGASTGTVSSRYNGAVSVSYDDLVALGLVSLTIGYQGDPNGGHFQTAFGASVDVTAYLPLIGAVTITNPNYGLAISRTYTPSPPDTVSGTDSFTPASSAIGPALPVLGSAQAGVDYDITQNATHTISALNGTVIATHQLSGDVRMAAFTLGSSDDIMLNLNEPGVWDVQLASLSLANLFSTDFDLDIVPFAQYILGFNCGEPDTDSDNGIGCGGDGRLDTNLANVDLFTNTPFALALTSSNVLPSFQITVTDAIVAAVPEPTSLALFGVGLLGLVAVRRRRSA